MSVDKYPLTFIQPDPNNKKSTHSLQTTTPNNSYVNNQTALLSATQLTCVREDRLLFDQLDIAINTGDIVQIEGENGSGKTSLLRLLAGLSQPFEGEVFFKDQSIQHCRETFHQNLLYLGHLAGVKGEMSAHENLHFNLALQGINHTPVETSKILADVNLTGFEDSLAAQLSAGQHRRISLARLYQTTATIWILDEPFTAIDKQGVHALELLFKTHIEQGGCIIFTSHQDLLTFKVEQVKKIILDDGLANDVG